MLKNNDYKKHKGEYLDQVVRQKGIKIKALTAAAHFDRSTYYNHIKEPNLPYKIMARYGAVLNVDFKFLYPEIAADQPAERPVITTFEDMEADRDYWRKQYDLICAEIQGIYNRNKK